MGDIIEFCTWQSHASKFYELKSSAFNFDVKSRGSVKVGLFNNPSQRMHCTDWFTLASNEGFLVRSSDNEVKSYIIANIFNMEEYTRFWISWDNNCVTLGKSEYSTPLLQYETKLPAIKYVTFGVDENQPPAYWKFELHPIIKEPKFTKICKGKLEWVSSNTQLPIDSVIGGFCNESIYVIRADHHGSLTPGGFAPSEGVACIPWGGEKHEKTTFDILCGFDYMWVPSENDKIPAGAFQAGYSEVNNETLYIGRAIVEGNLIPGKVQPSHKVCYVYSGIREIACHKYEILVVPCENIDRIGRRVQPQNFGAMTIEPNISYSVEIESNYSEDEDFDHNMVNLMFDVNEF